MMKVIKTQRMSCEPSNVMPPIKNLLNYTLTLTQCYSLLPLLFNQESQELFRAQVGPISRELVECSDNVRWWGLLQDTKSSSETYAHAVTAHVSAQVMDHLQSICVYLYVCLRVLCVIKKEGARAKVVETE